jgi:hypothetical protein
VFIDGLPLDFVSRSLPWRTRLSPGLAVHIHAHARSSQPVPDRPPSTSRTFSRRAFAGWLDSLEHVIAQLEMAPASSAWRDYYASQHNYGEIGLQEKERLVEALIGGLRPSMVWDLGANLGRFSRLATRAGAFTVALDSDVASVEENYRAVKSDRETLLLPLCSSLENPSPALGWAHEERLSLSQRGPADLILALGLIHHLAISHQLPLEWVASYFAQLGRTAIVEFIPPEDSQLQRLLAGREGGHDYTLAAFETAFAENFTIDERVPIPGTHRVLYLMSREPAP